MNRAARMLEVLRDHKPHARREIFERAGFMLTNNAAAELREQGYDVRQSSERVNGETVYSYQLHGSLSEGDRSESAGSRIPADLIGQDPSRADLSRTSDSPSESEFLAPPISPTKHDPPPGGVQLGLDGLHRREHEAA